MHNLRLLSFPAMALLAGTAAAQTAKPRSQAKLTIDQLVQIKHPSGHQWTPDGSRVWFTYDDGGINNVWAVAADGSGPPVALTSYPEGQTGNGGFWGKDSQTFFYQRDGGLLAVSVKGGAPHAAWPSAARASGFSLSPDGARVAFLVGQGRGGAGASGVDLIVHTIATDADQKLAHADGSIGGPSWSPDGAKLAFTSSAANGASDLVVANVSANTQAVLIHADSTLGAPSWTPDGANLIYSVVGGGGGGGPIQHFASPPEIGAKLIFVATEGGRGGGSYGTFIVPASGGQPPKSLAAGGGGRGGRGGNAWLDATHTLSMRTSNGGLTRMAESVDINGGSPVLLYTDTAAKFFSSVNTTNSAISPDRKWLLYTSDVTGWDQIYVVPTAGGTPTQLTKAPAEHWRAAWSHDSKRIAWDANTAAKP
ncbi:MAG TPA: hypothetical protein VK636_22875, partial [Gemmatimonadaceae bacterium]|nr:hypothetical protein [Gemmatimonadaceae bacterium]